MKKSLLLVFACALVVASLSPAMADDNKMTKGCKKIGSAVMWGPKKVGQGLKKMGSGVKKIFGK